MSRTGEVGRAHSATAFGQPQGWLCDGAELRAAPGLPQAHTPGLPLALPLRDLGSMAYLEEYEGSAKTRDPTYAYVVEP